MCGTSGGNINQDIKKGKEKKRKRTATINHQLIHLTVRCDAMLFDRVQSDFGAWWILDTEKCLDDRALFPSFREGFFFTMKHILIGNISLNFML